MMALFHIIPGGVMRRPGKKKGIIPGGVMKRAPGPKVAKKAKPKPKAKKWVGPSTPFKPGKPKAPAPRPATAPG